MDPDAALFQLREMVAKLERATDADDVDGVFLAANDVVNDFRGLDTWITRGGFLPKDWQPAHNPSTDVEHGVATAKTVNSGDTVHYTDPTIAD